MPSKMSLLAIVFFLSSTQLVFSSEAIPPMDENTTPEFSTERVTQNYLPSNPEACRPSENPTPQSGGEDAETEDLEKRVQVTMADLAAKIAKVQEVVRENQAMLSKLRRTPSRHEHYPQHCQELKDQGQNNSDVYFIKPRYAPEPFLVFCDMDTRGGGWTSLLSRMDGTLNFDEDWKNYKYGFGKLRHEFWLGLEKIHYLTGYEINELLIEVNEWGLKEAYFSAFSIGNEEEDFSIKLLDGYQGNTGSSLVESYGVKFSTKDKSLDPFNIKCAILSGGGWWHKNCGSAILTSKWTVYNVMSWQHSKMMVRPRNGTK